MDSHSRHSFHSTTEKSRDVDRGWAYVVAIAAVSSFFLGPGFTFSTGFLYVILLDEFEYSAAATAWILTVNSLFVFAMGPLSTYLNNWISIRKIVISGAILSTAGLMITSFGQTFFVVFFGFSVLSGIGWGVSCMWSFEMITQYFDKQRPFMLATISNGAGLGQFVIPLAFLFLMHVYGWRGAMFICAAVNLNLLVIAAVYMKPRKQRSCPSLLDHRSEQTKSSEKLSFTYPLKFPSFTFHNVGMCLSSIAVGAFQTHISNYGRYLDFTETQFTMLPSVSGIANTIGRLLVAIIIQTGKIDGIFLTMIGLTFTSAICVLCAFIRNYVGITLLTGMFGIGIGVWSLVPQVVVEIIGKRDVTNGTTQVLMLSSIGWMVGGPLAGLLKDIDASYTSSFIFMGVIQFLAVLFYIPAFRFHRPLTAELEIDVKLDNEDHGTSRRN